MSTEPNWQQEATLRAMKVPQLRVIANGMPYLWESRKEEVVLWILRNVDPERWMP